MSVLAPSPATPPRASDVEALIREARARQRRRVLITAAALLAVVAGLGALRGGSSGVSALSMGVVSGPPLVARFDPSTVGPRARAVWVGSIGGLTWAEDYRNVFFTTDDGDMWLHSIPPHLIGVGGTSLGNVVFVDPLHGWLSSNGHGVLPRGARTSHHWEIDRTTDGGKTWLSSRPPGCRRCDLASLSFFDTQHGNVLVPAPGGSKLFSTADGGATWQLVSKLTLSPQVEARFADAEHGIAVTYEGGMGTRTNDENRLFRTADGGRTWTPVRLDGYDPFEGSFGYPTITAVDGTLLIPAQRDSGGTAVYSSSDGGATWKERPLPAQVFFGYGYFSAPSRDVWITADDHSLHLFKSTDAGKTWQTIKLPPAFHDLHWIHFTSATVGWVSFGNYELARTTDGGAHWTMAGPPKPKVPKHR